LPKMTDISLAQLQRVRRAVAEHDRITDLANRLSEDVVGELDSAKGGNAMIIQAQLDQLSVLAVQRPDIQLNLALLFQRILKDGDTPLRQQALLAARSWQRTITDPAFTRWLYEVEQQASRQ